jgi:hypothetical protein
VSMMSTTSNVTLLKRLQKAYASLVRPTCSCINNTTSSPCALSRQNNTTSASPHSCLFRWPLELALLISVCTHMQYPTRLNRKLRAQISGAGFSSCSPERNAPSDDAANWACLCSTSAMIVMSPPSILGEGWGPLRRNGSSIQQTLPETERHEVAMSTLDAIEYTSSLLSPANAYIDRRRSRRHSSKLAHIITGQVLPAERVGRASAGEPTPKAFIVVSPRRPAILQLALQINVVL